MVDRAHPGFVTAVVFHPDRRRLFSASVDGTVNVWDLETASLVDRWECHSGGVNALAVEPRGAMAAHRRPRPNGGAVGPR